MKVSADYRMLALDALPWAVQFSWDMLVLI